MDPVLQAAASIALVVALIAALFVPLGNWMYAVFSSPRHTRAERVLYRIVGVDPDVEQRWTTYAIAVVAFGVVSVLLLWGLIVAQGLLPLGLGRTMNVDTALNTAVSFTTNTNWQSYAGEAGTGHLVQMAGLTVQNFVSAATGLAVAAALFRGLTRSGAHTVGNFWVDLTRASLRILLPIAVVGGLLLLAGGVIQNLDAPTTIATVTGGTQVVQGGPVASQEVIKLLGTNGGGFFNANSAHPFENPSALTNLLEIVLVLCIPFALAHTYGRFAGDRRQGLSLAAVMAVLWTASAALLCWAEYAWAAHGTALEGKETRFGVVWSALFGTATTGTSTGAVNSMHDSFSPLGGGLLMFNMMLGEVSPGGVGTGMYGLLTLALLAVFVAGLMVGRTPEILGKVIGRREITCVALTILTMPALVLLFTGAAAVLPVATGALLNTGPHGLSELLYAYTSASNNNGSAFAGLSADQPYLNLTLAFCMFAGRFVPIVLVLALAGSLAAQRSRPVTAGTMPTHGPTYVVLVAGIVLVVAGLTFFPALALGPLAEALR